MLVGYDESNDLAVLKIDAQGMTPVVMGSAASLHVGDEVVAIGNPLGELTFSLTKGTVSALDRAVTLSRGVTMNLIQTDAAINAGNSGGALFNLYGEVVGITNAKYSGSGSDEASIDNIGFAIPLNSVQSIITDIIETGSISKPYLGVTLRSDAEGAVVESVEAGSPAEEAGLQANDKITAVNGKAIPSAEELVAFMKTCAVGDQLSLTVLRGEQEQTLAVTVGARKQDALPQDDAQAQADADARGSWDRGENEMPWGQRGSEEDGSDFSFPFGDFSGEFRQG